uniref:Uncharacterized protein n=1 Tax=Anguilla anguilla TaxID=7936 RepID=A0A0E9V082_ANGAN
MNPMVHLPTLPPFPFSVAFPFVEWRFNFR